MGSSRLPSLKQAQMLKVLKRLGVKPVVNEKGRSRGKGSHVAVRAPSGRRSLVQDDNLPPSFVATILKQLGISEDDFLAAYHKRI